MPPETTPTTTPQVVSLRLEDIAHSPLNPRKRMDQSALHELADDIRLHGVLQPITVRRVTKPTDVANQIYEHRPYVIVMGERRWRAAGIADIETIPAIIAPDMDDATHLRMAYSENAHRSDLSPIECAAAYDRMLTLEPSLTQESLGKRLGVSQSRIANRLRLWRMLPLTVRDLVDTGALSEAVATELCRLVDYGTDQITAYADRALAEGWTQALTAQRVKLFVEEREAEEERKRAQNALPLDDPAPEPADTPTEADESSHPTEPQGKSAHFDYSARNNEEPATAETPGESDAELLEEMAADAKTAEEIPPPPAPATDALTRPIETVAPRAETPAPASMAASPVPETEVVDAPSDGPRMAASILQSDDDWLFEVNLTLDQAIALLRRHQPYLLSPLGRKLLKALIDERGSTDRPGIVLEAILTEAAEARGIDIETIKEIPE